jgi:tRNA(fMet)-specific endonuclease VapC
METERIGLDTSILIAFLRGREPAATALEKAVQKHTCFVAAITIYELIFGLARSGQSIGEDELLGLMTIIPVDGQIARRSAYLHQQLLQQGQDIGVKDVFIAATCLVNNLPLLTLNQRHFSRIADLSVITPENF